MNSVLLQCVASGSKLYNQKLVRLVSSGATSLLKEKSLNEVPGPLRLPLIGSSWQYMPIIGSLDMRHMDVIADYFYKKYGPIVYERLGNLDIVHLYKTEHFEAVVNATFNRPARPAFLAVANYRKSNPDKYNSIGLFPSNDEDWWKLRQSLQKPVSPMKETRDSLGPADDITKEFVDQLEPGAIVDNFMALAPRLNLELICKMLFGERLYCFNAEAMSPESFWTRLIDIIMEMVDGLTEQDNAEKSWSFVRNKSRRKLSAMLQVIEQFSTEMIEKVKARKHLSDDPSVIARYVTDSSLHEKEILGAVMDVFTGGVHSTSAIECGLLYEMCKSPEAQTKMIAEAKRLLPSTDSKISKDVLNDAVYTRGVVKETLRLHPVSSAVVRVLPHDVILDDYRIPKNTMVFLQNLTACRLEENFKDALKFNPENWIRGTSGYQRSNPFLMMPFSTGLRSCLARRRAEQNLHVFALRIFRRFNVKWMREDDLTYCTPTLLRPEGDVKLMFSNHC